jgi:hypothetical protein
MKIDEAVEHAIRLVADIRHHTHVRTGGGFGMLARRYGLASDRLVGIDMVDATGKIISANKTLNADLLWAHRGGGGGEALMTVCSHPYNKFQGNWNPAVCRYSDNEVQAALQLLCRQLWNSHEAQGGHSFGPGTSDGRHSHLGIQRRRQGNPVVSGKCATCTAPEDCETGMLLAVTLFMCCSLLLPCNCVQAKFTGLPDGISSDMFIGYGTVQLHALYLGSPTGAQSVLATAGMQVQCSRDADMLSACPLLPLLIAVLIYI